MSNSASPTALVDGPIAAGPRASLFTCFWLLACLATALAIFGFVHLVADQNEREAARTIVAAQRGDGYVSMLVTAFAIRHGRPDRGF